MPKVTNKRVVGGDQSIGAMIKRFRLQEGLSQTALGKMLDNPITFQQVQKYELGINRVSGARLVNIARLFRVSIDTLCGVTSKYEPHDDVIARLGMDRVGIDLATAFDKIKSPTLRRSIADHVKAVAEQCGESDADIKERTSRYVGLLRAKARGVLG